MVGTSPRLNTVKNGMAAFPSQPCSTLATRSGGCARRSRRRRSRRARSRQRAHQLVGEGLDAIGLDAHAELERRRGAVRGRGRQRRADAAADPGQQRARGRRARPRRRASSRRASSARMRRSPISSKRRRARREQRERRARDRARPSAAADTRPRRAGRARARQRRPRAAAARARRARARPADHEAAAAAERGRACRSAAPSTPIALPATPPIQPPVCGDHQAPGVAGGARVGLEAQAAHHDAPGGRQHHVHLEAHGSRRVGGQEERQREGARRRRCRGASPSGPASSSVREK